MSQRTQTSTILIHVKSKESVAEDTLRKRKGNTTLSLLNFKGRSGTFKEAENNTERLKAKTQKKNL